MSLEMIVILILLAFIAGLIVGVLISKPTIT